MKHSTDYHDYVFKNGRLIGQFEQMYRYSKDIPWHQDKNAVSFISHADIAFLRQFRYESICDVGCGFGYFTNRLHNELSSNEGKPKVTGIDISQTAIKKAKNLFPEIHFIKGDLIKERPLPGEYFDLVVLKESLWYVCHKLSQFLQNLLELVKVDGFLYVSQSFPAADKWVGQEIVGSPEDLKKILSQYLKPMHVCTKHNQPLCKNGCFSFLGKKLRE